MFIIRQAPNNYRLGELISKNTLDWVNSDYRLKCILVVSLSENKISTIQCVK